MLTAALLVAAVNVSAQPSLKQAQRDVKQLKKVLGKLQVQLKAERSKRSNEERAMHKNEKDIAALGSQINEIERQQLALNKNLDSYQADKSQIEQQLMGHRERLSVLLKQRYLLTEHTPIKLLLNQESPQQAARMLKYLAILRNFEAKQVLEFQNLLAKRAVNDESIDSTQAQLATHRKALQAKRTSLEKTRVKRQKNINQIDRNIAANKTKINKLAGDKKRLDRVLSRIEQVIVQNTEKRKVASVVDNRAFKVLKRKLKWPAKGRVLRNFGSIENSLAYDGILIRASQRSPVKAVHTGHVVFADWLRSYGMLLIVDHGAGYLTLYGHNDQLNKKVGDKVSPGEVIALVGSSGGNAQPGLYFAIRHNGKTTNPRAWLSR
ncbi:MAG: peptidoglycan DD-metalloendopeptidase family protein [Oceanospirillaceae bacterium]|nr:peptidoglycan DD-metalloendopeptidase family protein [Oceanospirillaceae bacterium]